MSQVQISPLLHRQLTIEHKASLPNLLQLQHQPACDLSIILLTNAGTSMIRIPHVQTVDFGTQSPQTGCAVMDHCAQRRYALVDI